MINNNIINRQKHVIDKVKTIVTHHKQLTQAKGELFNIYEILNLKTKEVRTHSAFIAELLKPNGTHLMGNAFLKAFFSFLPVNLTNHLDQETVTVIVEFHIGVTNKENKTGGRIDILLVDQLGATICIENKIDAGDGEQQVERYRNYNRNNNQVLYLSKFGDGPNMTSKGELIENNDFYIISYQNQIINWLEKCQLIACDQPILRESIKQYKILIQKLTNILGNKQDQDLETVVLNNLEEASLIASKYDQVIKNLKLNFRDKVLNLLISELEDYEITSSKTTSAQYSNIWFYNTQSNLKERWFAAESFSGFGHNNGVLFVGIFDKKGLNLDKNYNPLNKNWIHHQIITFDNVDVNLSDSKFLEKINNSQQLSAVAIAVKNQIICFIEENKNLLDN